MNVWTITGNLGQDPKLRQINNGDPVLNLSVAVSRRAKVDGQWQNVTMWVDVTLFGKRGESLHKILAKGMRVGATGELNLREYTGRDGVVKHQLELLARDIEPLEKAPEGSRHELGVPRGAPQQGRAQHRDQLAGQGRAPWGPDPDDDIPF